MAGPEQQDPGAASPAPSVFMERRASSRDRRAVTWRTLLVLGVTDAFLTVTPLTDGATESNPVLDEHPRLFAAAKMALTGFGVVVLVAVARLRVFQLVRASVFLQLLVIAYATLVDYEAWLVSLMTRY